MYFNRVIHSPSPSPYLALCAHVMPLWKPSSLQTTLASLMLTSSSHTVPHVPLCRTSTRPSFSLWPIPASRTLAAGARLERPGDSGRASVHTKRSAKRRQIARIMIVQRWGFWNTKQRVSLILNELQKEMNCISLKLHWVGYRDKLSRSCDLKMAASMRRPTTCEIK